MTDRTWARIAPYLKALFEFRDEVSWQAVFEWTMYAIMAVIIAVALVATFQPLYDLTHWMMPQ